MKESKSRIPGTTLTIEEWKKIIWKDVEPEDYLEFVRLCTIAPCPEALEGTIKQHNSNQRMRRALFERNTKKLHIELRRRQQILDNLTDRLKKLNKLSEIYVRLEKDKHFTKDDFIREYAPDFGLYVSVSEFTKHLDKAYQWGVIDYDPEKRRFIPIEYW